MNKLLLASAFSCCLLSHVSAQTPPEITPVNIFVQAGQSGIPIQPTMWGIFFEDINMAADGGLYAETLPTLVIYG